MLVQMVEYEEAGGGVVLIVKHTATAAIYTALIVGRVNCV